MNRRDFFGALAGVVAGGRQAIHTVVDGVSGAGQIMGYGHVYSGIKESAVSTAGISFKEPFKLLSRSAMKVLGIPSYMVREWQEMEWNESRWAHVQDPNISALKSWSPAAKRIAFYKKAMQKREEDFFQVWDDRKERREFHARYGTWDFES